MFKTATRTRVVWTLLAIAGSASLAGCTTAPLLPSEALAWTGLTANRTAARPREFLWPAAAPAAVPPSVAGPAITAPDLRGPRAAAPASPPAPVLRQNVADPPVSVTRPTVLPVTTASFDQHVLQSAVPVLVDFYADWCGPCKALAPTLEQVAAENPQARVVKVNIDSHPELAARYGVNSVPRLLVFKDGQIAAQHSGVVSKTRLNAMLAL